MNDTAQRKNALSRLICIEFFTTPRSENSTPAFISDFAGTITGALDTGASHNEVLYALLCHKLRNPQSSLMKQTAAYIEKNLIRYPQCTPAFIDKMKLIANRDVNLDTTPITLMARSAFLHATIPHRYPYGHFTPAEHIRYKLSRFTFNLLALAGIAGTQRQVTGFDPDELKI